MTVDPFVSADPRYMRAVSLGTRRLPLIPSKDERPGFGWVLAGVFAGFFVVGFALKLLWGWWS